MALNKAIKQKNGVILSYHRIENIMNVVNDKTVLTIFSYVDKEEREKEKKHDENFELESIYVDVTPEFLEYNDTLTIEQAYEYLKTTEKYKNAEDI